MLDEKWVPRFAEAFKILKRNGFSVFEMIRLCHSGLRRFDITKLLEEDTKDD